jgi:hypothetical protein
MQHIKSPNLLVDFSKNLEDSIEHEVCDYYPCNTDDTYCNDNGCRCRTITNINIDLVNMNKLVNELNCNLLEFIDKYALDRLMRVYKMYQPSEYNPEWYSGYYGDQFDGIYIGPTIAKLNDWWYGTYIACDSLTKKVEAILKLEYNNLSDQLIGKTWEIRDIDRNEIVIHNSNHMSKIIQYDHAFYRDYEYFTCLCLYDGKKYNIIDGHHRLNVLNNSITTIKCLVAV